MFIFLFFKFTLRIESITLYCVQYVCINISTLFLLHLETSAAKWVQTRELKLFYRSIKVIKIGFEFQFEFQHVDAGGGSLVMNTPSDVSN